MSKNTGGGFTPNPHLQEAIALSQSEQEPDRRLLGEVITRDMELVAPHLAGLSGNILLGNKQLQLVLAGSNPSDTSQEWTPLILRVYLWQYDKGWVLSPCLREVGFKRNWTKNSLKAKTTAIIPSIDLDRQEAHVDVVYGIEPNKAIKKEFFQIWLLSNSPSFYIVTDHAQFEKTRTPMQARMSFRAFIKSDQVLSEEISTTQSYEQYAFICKQEQWAVIGSNAYKAQYLPTEAFLFHTPGRNTMGWDGFHISMEASDFRTLHVSGYMNKHCTQGVKSTVGESLNDFKDCHSTKNLPILTLTAPLDDLSVPQRCVKILNERKIALTRTCFERGEQSIAIPLLPEQTYFVLDESTGQAWGNPSGILLKEAASETIHLPATPKNK